MDLDPNDPINILLRPFDAIPKVSAAATVAAAIDPFAAAQAEAQASQAAADAAAAAAEAERQRVLAEQQANLLRQGGSNNATVFGGAEGEVLYEANVRPSARRWESSNRVEIKRTVQDFNMSEPLPPQQITPNNAPETASSPISFSVPIQVAPAAPVAASPSGPSSPATQPRPKAKPAPAPASAPASAPAPSVFSPTAGVHPTQGTGTGGVNQTEELMKKVHAGSTKVRQCPSFRMLEFQLEYTEYKEAKTAVS